MDREGRDYRVIWREKGKRREEFGLPPAFPPVSTTCTLLKMENAYMENAYIMTTPNILGGGRMLVVDGI
jgi:hypothetical protein